MEATIHAYIHKYTYIQIYNKRNKTCLNKGQKLQYKSFHLYNSFKKKIDIKKKKLKRIKSNWNLTKKTSSWKVKALNL